MKKEKYRIEYIFDKGSKNSLWNHITTPDGLAEWFADEVSLDGDQYIFTWNNSSETADQIGFSPLSYIRFRWQEEDDPKAFFEFRLSTIELTGAIMLEIIDFAEPDEKEHSISLWESQVKDLKRSLGL